MSYRSRGWLRPLLLLPALLLAACTPAARSPDARSAPAAGAMPANYFAGKTITLLVPQAPGGPSTVFARLLGDRLKFHIPGEPTIVCDFKPGAGGLVGMNLVYSNAKKDGLTIGIFAVPLTPEVLGAEGTAY